MKFDKRAPLLVRGGRGPWGAGPAGRPGPSPRAETGPGNGTGLAGLSRPPVSPDQCGLRVTRRSAELLDVAQQHDLAVLLLEEVHHLRRGVDLTGLVELHRRGDALVVQVVHGVLDGLAGRGAVLGRRLD